MSKKQKVDGVVYVGGSFVTDSDGSKTGYRWPGTSSGCQICKIAFRLPDGHAIAHPSGKCPVKRIEFNPDGSVKAVELFGNDHS